MFLLEKAVYIYLTAQMQYNLIGSEMKLKTTIHIYYTKYEWQDKGDYSVSNYKFDDELNRTYVGQQEVELELPDNYDPRAQQVAALEKQKQKVMADYQKSVNEINDRISKLQALEYTA